MKYPSENVVAPRAKTTEPYNGLNPFSTEGRQVVNDERDEKHRDLIKPVDAYQLLGGSTNYEHDHHLVRVSRDVFNSVFPNADPDYQRGYRFQAENGDFVFDKHKLQLQASKDVEEARAHWQNDRLDETRDVIKEYEARRLLGSSIEVKGKPHLVEVPYATFNVVFGKDANPDQESGFRYKTDNGALIFDKHRLQVQASISVEEARQKYPSPQIGSAQYESEQYKGQGHAA